MQQILEDVKNAQIQTQGRHDVVGFTAVDDAAHVKQNETTEYQYSDCGQRKRQRWKKALANMAINTSTAPMIKN